MNGHSRAGKKFQKVVKLSENAKRCSPLGRTAHFTRRSPGNRDRLHPRFELVLIRARFYQPTTGEFTSQDPMEYVDGMSLYRGYFVPGGMDPFGLSLRSSQNNWHWHHILPNKFWEEFFEAGFDIDAKEWGVMLDPADHLRHIHGSPAYWNDEWADFFDEFVEKRRKATPNEIRAKALDIVEDYDHILRRGKGPDISYPRGVRGYPGQWKPTAKGFKGGVVIGALAGAYVFLETGGDVEAAVGCAAEQFNPFMEADIAGSKMHPGRCLMARLCVTIKEEFVWGNDRNLSAMGYPEYLIPMIPIVTSSQVISRDIISTKRTTYLSTLDCESQAKAYGIEKFDGHGVTNGFDGVQMRTECGWVVVMSSRPWSIEN